MMRGDKGGYKRSNRRMVRSKDKGSDESDEDYMVGEDEECDESEDEYCLTFDGDESEEILGDLEEEEEEFVEKKVKKVGRHIVKKAGRARGRKKNGFVKPKMKRRALYREEEEEEEEEEEDVDDDDDDADFDFDDEKKKKKKRVSFGEDDDDYNCADYDFDDEKVNVVAKPGKNKRVSCTEEDDDDYNVADDEFNDEKVNIVVKPRRKKRVFYREEDDDYDVAEDKFDDEKVSKVAKPRKKKGFSYREEDDDDYNAADGDFDDEKVNLVVKPREKRRVSHREEDDDYDVTEDKFDDEKVSKVAKPRKEKGFLYREEDDDDYNGADGEYDDEKVNLAVKPREKRRVSYREDDYDDDYNGADGEYDDEKVNLAVKPREKRRVSYREDDYDDYNGADGEYDDEKVNLVVRPREKRRVSYREDDYDDYNGADGEYDDEKVNLVVRPREKRRVSYREDDDDYDVMDDKFDDEKKVSKVARPRKKKEVSYREENDDYDGTDDDDDDYDGMDDGDDDEEFTPDETDGVGDEDELLATKKNKKVGRPRLQEKGITRGRKRKRNSKVLKKTVRDKPRKNRWPSRKGKTGNDGEFIDTKPIVEEKKKQVNGRGRRGRIVHFDSDFVGSGSSDYEYTISEEEREQMQEANEFCRSLTTSLRSSTSSNKLEEEKKMLTQRKCPARKGKEKVEDLKVEAGKQVCGICLTEEGKRTIRGTLNCCSHYFCFTCIMEWSKVESRCPLCKQRFLTITKPARSNTGFDLRTAVVQIPERDQVYQPSEEELQGFLDPYDNVICTECHHGGDDALMLLCDLCDSPAHTYCVGLGSEVPEGNWYCEGCRPAALGSSNPQVLTPTPDYRTNSNLSVGTSPVSSVRETFDLNEMYVPDTPLTQESSQFPSTRPSVGDVQLPSPASGSGAFTVLERRRIQHQIHLLLNNRRRPMDDRTSETPTTVSGHSLFGSQVGWSRELATQHVVTPERMPSNNIYFHGSLQDNTMSLLQNWEVPSARLTHIGGQLIQNQPSTSTNRSFSGYIQNEFAGLNTGIGLRLGHQQLQPCSGRSNIGSDANRSSYPFREAIVPSRTLQEVLRTQY